MTSLRMHRGLCKGPERVEIRCHCERPDGPFHHVLQKQSGPTGTEDSAEMSEKIAADGMRLTAPPSSVPAWLAPLPGGLLFSRGS